MHRNILVLFTGLLCLVTNIDQAKAYNVLHTSEGEELRWFSETIPYYINPEGFTDFPSDELQAVVERSFTTWVSLKFGAQFEFAGFTDVKSALDDDLNVIFFVQDPNSWKQMFGGQETALAITRTWAISTGEIQGFDLAFNDWNYTFTNTDDPDDIRTDFANTFTHEAGHILGLDHSAVEEAVLFTTSPQGETSKRVLSYDDIDGVRYLYRHGFQNNDGSAACSQRPFKPSGYAALLPLLMLTIPAGLVQRKRNRLTRSC